MLDLMDAGQIPEWKAFDRLQEEAERRAELAAKAEAGVKQRRPRRR